MGYLRRSHNGEEAIEAVKTLRPDVIVLDITMPKMSGLEAAPRIAKLGVGCRVLMFTMHDSERLASEVRNAQAQGLVLKSQAARDLIRAIERLLAGGTFFASEPSPKLWLELQEWIGPECQSEPGNQLLVLFGVIACFSPAPWTRRHLCFF